MKKLALALVCLISVAFFASCTPEGQPTISVLTEEGYVQNGDVITSGEDFNFGFVMASSIETGAELATVAITVNDTTITEKISGTEFTYKGVANITLTRELPTATITATVTDAKGETAVATITVSIEESQELVATPFEWYRLGSTQTGLAEFGLVWEQNAKETHAQIKPLEGVTLYKFRADKWAATENAIQKAALFADGAQTLEVYNNVSTSANGNYDDVIGTKMADGTLYLIHVTKCELGEYQSAGYPITITGEWK